VKDEKHQAPGEKTPGTLEVPGVSYGKCPVFSMVPATGMKTG